jgi:hypothetical protein
MRHYIEVAEAEKAGAAAGAVKAECEDMLAEAIPALNAALTAGSYHCLRDKTAAPCIQSRY